MTFYKAVVRPCVIGIVAAIIIDIFICQCLGDHYLQTKMVSQLIGMVSACTGVILGYVINYFVWLRNA